MKKHSMKKQKKKTDDHPLSGLLSIVGLMFPGVVYLLLAMVVFDVPNSPLLILGGFGALLIGLVLAFELGTIGIKRKSDGFPWTVEAIAAGIGISMIVLSLIFLTSPKIVQKFSGPEINFWLVLLAVFPVFAIEYTLFRGAMQQHCRSLGASRSTINKAMKGPKDYWWYSSLAGEYALGWRYPVNMMFTILVPIAFVLTLFLGWCPPLRWPLVILAVAICWLLVPMLLFAAKAKTQAERRSLYRVVVYYGNAVAQLWIAVGIIMAAIRFV